MPWIHRLNRAVSLSLRPLGVHIPELQLIWVLGGVPLTFLIVLMVMWTRHARQKQWIGVLTGFIIGSVIEVLAKHFIVLPSPPNVAPPGLYRTIVASTNISPQQIVQLIYLVLGHPAKGVSHFRLLQGSFPSGHLFRITYALLVITGRGQPNVKIALAATLATFCVVATGGHWIWDAVGGVALATLIATWFSIPRGELRPHSGIR